MSATKSIGTKKEKSLHAALKLQYAGDHGIVEAAVGQFVCDALKADGDIIEVQTGNFGSIKKKLMQLTKTNKVTLVHPIPHSRTIEVRDTKGILIRRRKSPIRGSAWDLFSELIRAPLLPLTPGLTIELVFVDETELRIDDGAGSWRRKGVSIVDRRLDAVRDTIVLADCLAYRRFLPEALPLEFSGKELAVTVPVRAVLARKALYVLKRIGLVEEIGKKGNSKVYRKAY
ncbi:MAG: hypothetical protein WCT14_19115 [Treponemataceae bacterium]